MVESSHQLNSCMHIIHSPLLLVIIVTFGGWYKGAGKLEHDVVPLLDQDMLVPHWLQVHCPYLFMPAFVLAISQLLLGLEIRIAGEHWHQTAITAPYICHIQDCFFAISKLLLVWIAGEHNYYRVATS